MILQSDARRIPLVASSVHCVVTSPPYWGLRDYGLPPLVWGGDPGHAHEWGEPVAFDKGRGSHGDKSTLGGRTPVDGEDRLRSAPASSFCQSCGAWRGCIGLEPTPDLYVAHMVEVFREVRRVLRDDGTLWLNLGDSYANTGLGDISKVGGFTGAGIRRTLETGKKSGTWQDSRPRSIPTGLKPKDMVGIPWCVASALQADGWWLRSDIIWSKPNPMPESVTDRPTKSHEYLFLLAKSERYYYDAEAIKENFADERMGNPGGGGWYHRELYPDKPHAQSGLKKGVWNENGKMTGRNRRTVWEIATQPYPEAHFATFPEALVEPCVLAGTSEYGVCRACGAPWERMGERSGRTIGQSWPAHSADGMMGQRIDEEMIGKSRDGSYKVETKGWEPTCGCADGPRAKPLVLDPFAGSGTVGLVCHRLGRRFVGLDLKDDYCRLAYARTAQLGLL